MTPAPETPRVHRGRGREPRHRHRARAQRLPEQPGVLLHAVMQIAAGEAPKDRTFRIGGMVQGRQRAAQPDLTVNFVITDTVRE